MKRSLLLLSTKTQAHHRRERPNAPLLLLLGVAAFLCCSYCWPTVLLWCEELRAMTRLSSRATSIPSNLDAAGSRAGGELPGRPVPEATELKMWIEQQGGKVAVEVRDIPGSGRITVAPADFKAGDILAAIPRKACFPVVSDDERVAAALLWKELRDPGASAFAPYLKLLPARADVWNYYSLPASYLPLIQNKVIEEASTELERLFEGWFSQQREAALGPELHRQVSDMTLDDLRYAMALIKTRQFGDTRGGSLLVPILDLANHHNGCSNTITSYADCGPGAEEGCLVWRAGADIPRGVEVCNIYHPDMPQDATLLLYGFLQSGAPAGQLSSIDRHDYDGMNPWTFNATKGPFQGTAAEMLGEVTRLTQLLSRMRALDVSLQRSSRSAVSADKERDPDGSLLHQLLVWRRQRQAAAAAEVQQLLEDLQQLHSAGTKHVV